MTDDYDSGQWDALFAGDEDTRVMRGEGAGVTPVTMQELREVPGVKAALQVAHDGILQAHAVEGSPEQVAAITAYLSATARQVGAAMGFQSFDHASLNIGDSGDPILVIRHGSSYLGLLLDGEIAASHILSRIHERLGGKPR
jgi:predicted regulator of Ras-like GTPase activity (Roadblock/LC7/MglB family)